MSKGKNSKNSSTLIGFAALAVILFLAIDMFTTLYKYYNINQANVYVAEILQNQDSVGDVSTERNPVTIEEMYTKLSRYYDKGFMSSRPAFFIGGEMYMKSMQNEISLPPGKHKITMRGFHETYLLPPNFGNTTEITSTRTIKK